jgi:hypothetical protein
MTEVTVVRRWTPVVLAAALAASVAGLAGGPAYASAGSRPVLSVGGEVTTAASYTVAQLAALPQTTVTVKVGGRQVTDATARPPSPWASWTPGSATIRRCWR